MSSEGEAEAEAEAQYFCKDFDWEDLRAEIEANPSFAYHLESSSSSSSAPPESDVQAWKQFHLRHASGKFFKVPSLSLFAFSHSLSLTSCFVAFRRGAICWRSSPNFSPVPQTLCSWKLVVAMAAPLFLFYGSLLLFLFLFSYLCDVAATYFRLSVYVELPRIMFKYHLTLF